MRNTVNMEIEDLKAAVRALMERIQGFNDGCDCCASINAEDTNEYATLEVALSALEEAQEARKKKKAALAKLTKEERRLLDLRDE